MYLQKLNAGLLNPSIFTWSGVCCWLGVHDSSRLKRWPTNPFTLLGCCACGQTRGHVRVYDMNMTSRRVWPSECTWDRITISCGREFAQCACSLSVVWSSSGSWVFVFCVLVRDKKRVSSFDSLSAVLAWHTHSCRESSRFSALISSKEVVF